MEHLVEQDESSDGDEVVDIRSCGWVRHGRVMLVTPSAPIEERPDECDEEEDGEDDVEACDLVGSLDWSAEWHNGYILYNLFMFFVREGKSTTIAVSSASLKSLLMIEHEMELKTLKSVSHGEAIEFLIQEYKKHKAKGKRG